MLNIIGICMVIFGVLGISVSILLTFLWKIPDLLDELSGKKAKRQIKRLRELNIGTGGIEGISTNELYEMINNSGNLVWKNIGSGRIDFEQEVKSENEEIEDVEEEEAPVPENIEDKMSESVIINRNEKKVSIIKEQTSIDLEVQGYEK